MINILKIYNNTIKVISRMIMQTYQENFSGIQRDLKSEIQKGKIISNKRKYIHRQYTFFEIDPNNSILYDKKYNSIQTCHIHELFHQLIFDIMKYNDMPTSFFINGTEFKAISYYVSDLTAIYPEKYISNTYGIGVHSILTVGTKEYCDDQTINSIDSSYMYGYTFT